MPQSTCSLTITRITLSRIRGMSISMSEIRLLKLANSMCLGWKKHPVVHPKAQLPHLRTNLTNRSLLRQLFDTRCDRQISRIIRFNRFALAKFTCLMENNRWFSGRKEASSASISTGGVRNLHLGVAQYGPAISPSFAGESLSESCLTYKTLWRTLRDTRCDRQISTISV